MVYTLHFSLQNAVCFLILTYLVPVLLTFYIQDVLKFKKNNSGAKRLIKDDSNYMFRPIAAIIRFSSESMVVVLYRIVMGMSRW